MELSYQILYFYFSSLKVDSSYFSNQSLNGWGVISKIGLWLKLKHLLVDIFVDFSYKTKKNKSERAYKSHIKQSAIATGIAVGAHF